MSYFIIRLVSRDPQFCSLIFPIQSKTDPKIVPNAVLPAVYPGGSRSKSRWQVICNVTLSGSLNSMEKRCQDFNRFRHVVLVHKTHQYGISCKLLLLIKSFLASRMHVLF